MQRLWILLVFFITEGHQTSYKLPGYIAPCKNDANISKCTRQVLQDVKPYLVKGIAEFHLPSIDPLHIPMITIERKNSRIADYVANVTNARWIGGRNFQVTDTFVNMEKLIFHLKLRFPYLLLDAEAYLRGTFLSFEINGTGGGLINYTNVMLDVVLNGKPHENEEYIMWHVEDIGVDYDDVYYVNLYGFFEDATVTHLLKLAVNRASRLLGCTHRPLIRSVGDFIVEAINRVFKLYSKDVLYPV